MFQSSTTYEIRQTKILLKAEKYNILPDHPMKTRLNGFAKNRPKRSSFVHETKRLEKVFAPEPTIATTPISRADITDGN